MNRRDFFQRVLALPIAAKLAPAVLVASPAVPKLEANYGDGWVDITNNLSFPVELTKLQLRGNGVAPDLTFTLRNDFTSR